MEALYVWRKFKGKTIKMRIGLFLGVLMFSFGCNKFSSNKLSKHVPYFSVYSSELASLIDTNARFEVIVDGYKQIKSLLWMDSVLVFTNDSKEMVHKWAPQKKVLPLFKWSDDRSNNEKLQISGIALDKNGKLLMSLPKKGCIGRLTSSYEDEFIEYEVITSEYAGKPYKNLYDLCVDTRGNVFYTDSPSEENLGKGANVVPMPFGGLYLLKADSSQHLLDNKLHRLGGIALSPNMSKLYATSVENGQIICMEYRLNDSQRLISKKVIFSQALPTGQPSPLHFGIAVSKTGFIFMCGKKSIIIIDALGNKVGDIFTDVPVSNCTFDRDESFLYFALMDKIIRVPLKKI